MQAFTVYVPVYVFGNGAEITAEQVDAGDLVSVDGRLGWRGTLQKNGCKIGLVVTCFGVDIITKATVQTGPTPTLLVKSKARGKANGYTTVKARKEAIPL